MYYLCMDGDLLMVFRGISTYANAEFECRYRTSKDGRIYQGWVRDAVAYEGICSFQGNLCVSLIVNLFMAVDWFLSVSQSPNNAHKPKVHR